LVVTRSPFPAAVRALLPFGLLLSYEYAVVARSYSASLFLLCAAAALYAQRERHPYLYFGCLGLVFQTSAHAFVPGGMLLLVSFVERILGPRRPPAGGLALASGLALLGLAQILPEPPDGQVLLLADFDPVEVVATSWRAPLLGGQQGPLWTAVAFAFLALALWHVRRAWRPLLFLVGSLLGLWALLVGIYPGALRHWGFLFVALVIALWMAEDERADPSGSRPSRPSLRGDPLMSAFAAVLLVNAVGGSRAWWREVLHPYSMSEAAAAWLREHERHDVPLAGHQAPEASSILPYLGRASAYYPGIDELGSHMRWDRRYVEGLLAPLPVVLARTRRFYPGGDPLLVLNYPADDPALRLVHAAVDPDTIVPDENYYFYRFR
jgi:hypothetical protein